ncbi:molybdenum cofactor biosynthesis protein C [Vulcanibacillus modesticaldus]|uniref:Cyclic pyranopterin monophosphate synthase n=1 Tax=Vulcanibacillus modesticaldus TaxID=337097 RepID=A0A1D2YWP7_9BACI|nr:cyclic pyranopterin monophosphate synthase MoaC [Vulcanibacillus modesticaldus]OEG00043.1 molybdenum cofactor biosynthesis protein C [Vulcanibacillus modesticaldus]
MNKLTHFNTEGRAKMVDVSEKQVTKRVAVARGSVRMLPETLQLIRDRKVGKGDVLAVAQVAGVMAAKKTSDLIPMCHPIPITGVDISFKEVGDDTIVVESTVKTTNVTGVEMEALTAVSVAMLTIYDMCKAVDKGMVLGDTYLVSKSGGKSGDYVRKMGE